MMSNINSNTISLFAPYYETDNAPFVMKIGGTTYEVSLISTQRQETVLRNSKIYCLNLIWFNTAIRHGGY